MPQLQRAMPPVSSSRYVTSGCRDGSAADAAGRSAAYPVRTQRRGGQPAAQEITPIDTAYRENPLQDGKPAPRRTGITDQDMAPEPARGSTLRLLKRGTGSPVGAPVTSGTRPGTRAAASPAFPAAGRFGEQRRGRARTALPRPKGERRPRPRSERACGPLKGLPRGTEPVAAGAVLVRRCHRGRGRGHRGLPRAGRRGPGQQPGCGQPDRAEGGCAWRCRGQDRGSRRGDRRHGRTARAASRRGRPRA